MEGKLQKLKQLDQFALTAVNNVYREQLTRVFVDGKKSNNSPMGTYSEKYRELKRKKIGTGGKVDLVFTSQFRAAFGLDNRKNEIVLGFQNASRRNLSGGSAKVQNSEIRRYSEDRYGVIFDMTDSEYSNAQKAIAFRINEIISE